MPDHSTWLPSDRVYDGKSYLWIKDDSENGRLLIGIGLPTIESLGELAYLTISGPGTQVKRGDSIGSMEAAKMTGEIVSPVSGTIVERNDAVLEDPRKINIDPYGKGWLLAIVPDSWNLEKAELHDASSLFELLPDDLRGPQTVH